MLDLEYGERTCWMLTKLLLKHNSLNELGVLLFLTYELTVSGKDKLKFINDSDIASCLIPICSY